ncbi:disulfide bond formation protein B [Beijerinckiaceae bacterium]|nr:disulfide bond formation protein B [Beijerinckiaceae bacterium]
MRLKPPLAISLAILAIAVLSIVGALIFEALGYAPCELCLKERIPYYVAIPIAALAVLFAAKGPKIPLIAAFAALALIFAGSAMFGAYHSGVEWGFWPGPKECTGSLDHAASVGDFLKQLQTVKVTRCDAAALHVFGLSLAAWNTLISLGLTGLALLGLRIKS